LRRCTTDRVIVAIYAGIGEYSNAGPAMVRLMSVLLFYLTGGGMIMSYLIIALKIAEEPAR
jgi:phage shock protein PspC (stress-responsive transcriptional regulator)